MNQVLHIFAEITPKAEFFDAAQDAILNILSRTRAEASCQKFELYAAPDGHVLYLVEAWASRDALDVHHAQQYTAAVFKSYENWLAQPPRIVEMTAVA